MHHNLLKCLTASVLTGLTVGRYGSVFSGITTTECLAFVAARVGSPVCPVWTLAGAPGTPEASRTEFPVAMVRNKRSYLRAVVPAVYQMPQPLRDGAT